MASASRNTDATIKGLGLPKICVAISEPRELPSSSEDTRVTIRPAAVEMSSAGICETSPSPMVKRP